MSVSVAAATTIAISAIASTILPGSTTPLIPLPTASSTLSTPSVTSDGGDITTGTLPPMTTHWSRPMSCTWTYVVDYNMLAGVSDQIAWLDLEPRSGATTLSCYPDGMFSEGRTGVFSPATCPNGWTTVSVSVNTDQDPKEATTTALCCSSEYELSGGHCQRTVPTVLAVPIIYNSSAATYDVLANSTTTLYSATIAVNTIRALFREVDKPLLGLTDEDEIDDEPENGNGLSIGAKIGIGIGVTIFGLMVIAAAIFTYLWRREHKRNSPNGRFSHEMESVHRSLGGVYGSSSLRRAGNTPPHEAEPPPVYIPSETNSLTDDESDTPPRRNEIKVLMAQKAAIERRIEELGSAPGDIPRARGHDD